jgi:hypothetical protein
MVIVVVRTRRRSFEPLIQFLFCEPPSAIRKSRAEFANAQDLGRGPALLAEAGGIAHKTAVLVWATALDVWPEDYQWDA